MSQYQAVLDLSTLDGTNGFAINGETTNDYAGISVSSAGDINADGFADILIGATGLDLVANNAGGAYIVFGKASSVVPALDLSTLDGNNGFQMNGEVAFDRAGISVSSAGDMNGDGLDDFIVGAFGADPNGSASGAAYIVFGSYAFGASLNFSSLDGNNGFQLNGEAGNDRSCQSVSSAGDVNGDGFDDIVVGANGADPNGSVSGAAYVLFGKNGGFGANFELSALDGNNGFQLNGEAAGDYCGTAVSAAGDFNGDGFDDLIVGAYQASPNGGQSGASYIVYGAASGFGSSFNLSLLGGPNGFQINGEAGSDRSGLAVSAAGDINHDGYDDVIVGAYRADPNGSESGSSYVVFGRRAGIGATLELSSLNGANGFQISGERGSDHSGRSVSGAGDVNGDGFDDLLVGAYDAYATGGGFLGAAYVVFGKAAGFAPNFELSAIDGNNGFRLTGEGGDSGFSVSAAGDVNGDGFDDVLVGGPFVSGSVSISGVTYVVYGSMPDEAVFRVGTTFVDDIHGGNFDDTLVGLSGNDVLTAYDGDDTIVGADGSDAVEAGGGDDNITLGSGNDFVEAGAGDDTAGGGSGNDSFYGGTGDDVLHGRSGIDGVYGGDDDDELYGNSGDDLMTGDAGVDFMDGGSGSDYLSGGTGSDTMRGGSNDDTLGGDDGNDTITGGDGIDILNGGNGDDRLTGGDGKDSLNGGAGVDRFIYETSADSTSVNYDNVKDADFAADRWDVDGNVTAIDAAVASGNLATSGFDTKLAAAVGAAQLGAHHAVLFTPTTGGLSGKTFLVVDLNGLAGYQASVDLVIELRTPANLGNIDAGDFI